MRLHYPQKKVVKTKNLLFTVREENSDFLFPEKTYTRVVKKVHKSIRRMTIIGSKTTFFKSPAILSSMFTKI